MAEPPPGHKIIGFYGRSGTWGMCYQFGIISAPIDVDLPISIWDLPELNNTNSGIPGKKVSCTTLLGPRSCH